MMSPDCDTGVLERFEKVFEGAWVSKAQAQDRQAEIQLRQLGTTNTNSRTITTMLAMEGQAVGVVLTPSALAAVQQAAQTIFEGGNIHTLPLKCHDTTDRGLTRLESILD